MIDGLPLISVSERRPMVPGDSQIGQHECRRNISAKRPYGNSYVGRDIAEILNAPDGDYLRVP